MKRATVPWQEIRGRFARGETCAALAQCYGIAPSTVARHARQEQWQRAQGDSSSRHRMEQAVEKLQRAAEELLTRLQSGDADNVRQVKDLASLLRELAALEKSLEEDRPVAVRVVLSQPLDDWAQ